MIKSKRHPINGVLLANKPKGLTSNACLQKIKWIYQASKAGHTGSLDPLATGMLPICFGEATKFSQYLLDSDKCYEARGRLGIKTNTGDALGEKLEEISDFKISEEDLLKTISNFVGNIQQIPSSFSALKYHGKPLYHYARQGITVPAKSRKIMIRSIELKEFDGVNFDLSVHCSKGTYIRNLVEDIGDFLKVGAHVTALHRTSVAGFERQRMHSLEDLDRKPFQELASCLLPLDSMLSNFPAMHLDNKNVYALRCGQMIQYENSLTSSLILPSQNNNPEKLDFSVNKLVRLYQRKNSEFIGLGVIEDNLIKAKRLISTQHPPLNI